MTMQKYLLSLTGIVLFTLSGLTSARATDYAFLVAVQDYDVKQLKPLNYTRNDILAFQKALIASGYDKDNVVLMHDDLKTLGKLRYIPESDKIRDELKLLLGTLEASDTIIVAFAGHGVQYKGEDENYFCPADTDLNDEKRQTLIALSEIYEALEKTKARKRLLLVDACRNDPQSQLGRSSSKARLESVTRPQITPPPKGVVALFSCSEGQQAYEWPDLKHGVFFYHVLQAWQQPQNDLSLDQLIFKAKSETKRFARLNLGTLQSPEQKGFFPGEWVLRTKIDPKQFTNSIGMQLVKIPAGEFLMGSRNLANEIARLFDSKAEYYEDVHPEHRVKLSRPFYMATSEVTQRQWKTVMGTEPWKGKEYVREGADYAASYVSWEEATQYCRKLSEKEGKTYRLPTEAEWEFACRAGSRTVYSFGDDASSLSEYAWYDVNAYDIDEKFAHRVAQKRSNAFGLYDMHGNVWEWCQDWYGDDYYRKSPTADPSGPSSGSGRVLRGGSWLRNALFNRSTDRDWNTPDYRLFDVGFRVVCELY
ncbi:SUMF1/EgtB/PvdO family nonheme iron enzyme [Gimesia sp.]|uniref:SUMF1/EgtB/PvdO family nonheme iron enzyme n=1 Tax=Gimesia sp. TaxID=2024833 RepID=UPI003A8FB0A6